MGSPLFMWRQKERTEGCRSKKKEQKKEGTHESKYDD